MDHTPDPSPVDGPTDPLDPDAARPTVLLAVDHDANRRQLRRWLPDGVEVVRPDGDGLPRSFDVCVVDEPAFGRVVSDLDAAKADASPTFLPVLLVVSRDSETVDDAVWAHVDDLIEAPVSTDELAGRLRVLLRARRASTAVVRERDRLEQVTSIMAHDLRNPLGVARGYVDHARATGDTKLDRIEGALDRMDVLIDDILTLARHGRDGLEVDTVPLGRLVDAAWETVEGPDASLEVDLPDGTTLWADAGPLREALENLFRNAVEHGGDDVRIRVGSLPDHQGFYVEDDGPGITPGEREDVLEFGYTTTDSGTGLGLAIVARILEAHGWDLRVASAESGGARFEVRGCRFHRPGSRADGGPGAGAVTDAGDGAGPETGNGADGGPDGGTGTGAPSEDGNSPEGDPA